jgi:hypothetical protein
MADRKNKFKKVAAATSRRAQKKGVEDEKSFYEDVDAQMAIDMEKWDKQE